MEADFRAMLAGYERAQQQASPSPLEWLRGWFEVTWMSPLAGRLAFGLVMLLLGWGAGYWFAPRTGGPAPDAPVASAGETGRQDMVLTLISQASATDRLKAVGYTSELQQADERVIKALLFTLNHDENVNVRLVTVEALFRFAADPAVREGLVRSIPQQESPLVQIALADAMVALHEKRSVAPLRELLRRQGTDVYVKEKLESSIRVLL
jgi:HEAT repeat protein